MRCRRTVVVVVAGLLLSGVAPPAAPQDSAPLAVENHAAGETVRYPVVLLRGRTAAGDAATVVVRNLDSKRPTRETTVRARGGRFKALAELVPGANRLVVECGAARVELTLRYRPQTTPNVVRFSWIVGSDGDATYQSERTADDQDFRSRVDTAAKLLQTFCAERLADAGLGRRTFRLELDEAGQVVVHVVRAPKSGDAYRAYTDDQALWRELGTVVATALPREPAKDVALMAFTRFDPATRRARAHTALGGGDFGLFGSAGVFAWPARLGDVEAAFTDTHPVDAARTHDDSVGRSVYWGLASTTLGAVMHETGHAFGLPHSTDPLDIMTRGFDRLNRVFTVVEPPSKSRATEVVFGDAEVAGWGSISGPRLAFSPFFEMDPPGGKGGAPPTVQLDADRGKVVVRAPNGLAALGIDSSEPDGGWLSRETIVLPEPLQKVAEFDVADLRRRAGGRDFGLVAFDGRRNRVDASPNDLRDPREFVRTWTFDADARAWTDTSKMPPPDAARPAKGQASRGSEAATSATPYVDLIPRYGATPNRVATARTGVRLKAAAKLRLLTGSDDTLRVWIDGKPVVEKFVFRGAAPDQDATDVDLAAGEHAVTVEVANGAGGWGFFLRFADAQGGALRCGPTGLLSAP